MPPRSSQASAVMHGFMIVSNDRSLVICRNIANNCSDIDLENKDNANKFLKEIHRDAIRANTQADSKMYNGRFLVGGDSSTVAFMMKNER
jgi:hypothetical protein